MKSTTPKDVIGVLYEPVINSKNSEQINETNNPTIIANLGLIPLAKCFDLNSCLLFLSIIFAIKPPMPVTNGKDTKKNITKIIALYPKRLLRLSKVNRNESMSPK